MAQGSPPLAPGAARVVVACTEPEALRVRPLALAAYDEARAREWPFLSDVLERTVREAPAADRKAATAVVHALAKYDRLLAFATESQSAAARFDALFAFSRGDAPQAQARIDRIESRTERLAVTFSFPNWIVDLVGTELGDAALLPALNRMNETAPRVGRANTLLSTRDACLQALRDEGTDAVAAARSPAGILFGGDSSPFRTQAFANGAFEMQDEASQFVADLVAPPPRSFVVDACAGAGGKTLALAALLEGKGRVIALDASESKLVELRRRAKRASANNVRAVAVDLLDSGERLREFEGRAARVLLDAPCSGLGAVRRNPEARWRLRPGDLARLVETQAALTRAAGKLVAPHGRLIFATCSFLPREGERSIERFLSESPEFIPVTARDVLGRVRTAGVTSAEGRYLATWRFDGSRDGGDDGMDGFFAAVVRRRAPAA